MSRRARGEGSIYANKRRGDYDAAYTHQGKRIVIRGRPGETKEQLARRLGDAIDDARESAVAYQRQTVAQYVASWLASREADLAPATTRTYEWAVRCYIVPALGAVRLRDLTPQHVDDAVTRWRRHASASTAAYARMVLVDALSSAVRKRLVTYNAASLSDRPRAERRERKPLVGDEPARFLAAIETDRLRALWMLGMLGGLRISEALGLTWDRVDLRRGRLTIDRQLQRVRDEEGVYQWQLRDLKTRSSRREVELPPACVAALERHRREQLEERLPVSMSERLVFISPRGTPLYAGNVLQILFRLERNAGLPRTVFHALRHTYGMLLREAGVELEVIQRMMGHASLAITSGIYGHDRPDARRAAADALEGLI